MIRLVPLALLVFASGCGSRPVATPANPPKVDPVKTFAIRGVVRGVSPDEGRVTLHHEEIPGYMPAMTMPFDVPDKHSLEGVNLGDTVSAALKVDGERSELADLTVDLAEQAPAIVLNLSGDEARLETAPRKLEPGEEVPDFLMTTQEGNPLRLSELRGKVVAITFIFTRCPRPDFCPRMDERFAELARKLSIVKSREDRVRLLSVSFDPEHDTPKVLARHAKLRGANPPLWRFAVATHDELRKVVRQLGLTYGPVENEIIHTLSTAIVDPQGRLVEIKAGSSWSAEEVYTIIRKVLRDEK